MSQEAPSKGGAEKPKTGRIRGWLCRNCNLGMGLLGDSQDGLLNAVAYLKSKE